MEDLKERLKAIPNPARMVAKNTGKVEFDDFKSFVCQQYGVQIESGETETNGASGASGPNKSSVTEEELFSLFTEMDSSKDNLVSMPEYLLWRDNKKMTGNIEPNAHKIASKSIANLEQQYQNTKNKLQPISNSSSTNKTNNTSNNTNNNTNNTSNTDVNIALSEHTEKDVPQTSELTQVADVVDVVEVVDVADLAEVAQVMNGVGGADGAHEAHEAHEAYEVGAMDGMEQSPNKAANTNMDKDDEKTESIFEIEPNGDMHDVHEMDEMDENLFATNTPPLAPASPAAAQSTQKVENIENIENIENTDAPIAPEAAEFETETETETEATVAAENTEFLNAGAGVEMEAPAIVSEVFEPAVDAVNIEENDIIALNGARNTDDTAQLDALQMNETAEQIVEDRIESTAVIPDAADATDATDAADAADAFEPADEVDAPGAPGAPGAPDLRDIAEMEEMQEDRDDNAPITKGGEMNGQSIVDRKDAIAAHASAASENNVSPRMEEQEEQIERTGGISDNLDVADLAEVAQIMNGQDNTDAVDAADKAQEADNADITDAGKADVQRVGHVAHVAHVGEQGEASKTYASYGRIVGQDVDVEDDLPSLTRESNERDPRDDGSSADGSVGHTPRSPGMGDKSRCSRGSRGSGSSGSSGSSRKGRNSGKSGNAAGAHAARSKTDSAARSSVGTRADAKQERNGFFARQTDKLGRKLARRNECALGCFLGCSTCLKSIFNGVKGVCLCVKRLYLTCFYLYLMEMFSALLFVFSLLCVLVCKQGERGEAGETVCARVGGVEMKRVLVTSARKAKSLGLIRGVKRKFAECEIYCCDSFILHCGRFSKCVKKGFVVPLEDKFDDYLSAIVSIVEKFDIDVVMVGSDAELAHLDEMKLALGTVEKGCKVVCAVGLERFATLGIGVKDDVLERALDVKGLGVFGVDASDSDSNSNSNSLRVFWLFEEILALFGMRDMYPAPIAKDAYIDLLHAHAARNAKSGRKSGENRKRRMVSVDEKGFLCFDMKRVLVGRDAVLNVYDPLPAFVLHCVQIPLFVLVSVVRSFLQHFFVIGTK